MLDAYLGTLAALTTLAALRTIPRLPLTARPAWWLRAQLAIHRYRRSAPH